MSAGICPFALQCPGPEWKRGYGRLGDRVQTTHAKVGVVLHSAEYESTPEWNDYTTLHNTLFSDREASWTFTICEFMGGALLFQHYPLGTTCWAQGYLGNLWLDSVEFERIAPHKLTEPMYELLVKLLRWIKQEHGWQEQWDVGNRGWVLSGPNTAPALFEHNNTPGAPPTNCAVFTNEQVDPQQLIRDLKEEPMPEIDWPKAKLDLLNDFLAWWTHFPQNQGHKDNQGRQAAEEAGYRRFYQRQIKWRGPG